MTRARWIEATSAVLVTMLELLPPQERDAAFEELVAKVRTKRAKSRSAVLTPIPREDPDD